MERFDGEVPPRLADLVTLPGVGRKTANVVLGNAFGIPGITVDTHFGRLARRFGWTTETDPVKVEHEVGALFPQARLDDAVARPDLPRPADLPRQEAGLRRLPGRPAVPVVRRRARPTRSRPASCSSTSAPPEALRRERTGEPLPAGLAGAPGAGAELAAPGGPVPLRATATEGGRPSAVLMLFGAGRRRRGPTSC